MIAISSSLCGRHFYVYHLGNPVRKSSFCVPSLLESFFYDNIEGLHGIYKTIKTFSMLSTRLLSRLKRNHLPRPMTNLGSDLDGLLSQFQILIQLMIHHCRNHGKISLSFWLTISVVTCSFTPLGGARPFLNNILRNSDYLL